MRYLLLVSLVFVFLGCSAKKKVEYFDEGKTQQQALINTRKIEFNLNHKRYLLTSTYLNPIQNSSINTTKETFLINIYSNDKGNINITGSSLNGNINGVQWQEIDINSTLAKYSPTYSKWSKYYLIQAPLENKPKLNLLIEIDNSKRVDLQFLKDILG